MKPGELYRYLYEKEDEFRHIVQILNISEGPFSPEMDIVKVYTLASTDEMNYPINRVDELLGSDLEHNYCRFRPKKRK